MRIPWFIACLFSAANLHAQITFTDSFSTPHNYLSNGIVGTVWDGIYLGAGEIANPMGTWVAPGSVSLADSGMTSNGVLTVASLQTDWENDSDDGFFLFKVVTGDFDMSVQVVGPIDTRAHHFPGLMVRAFGPGGSPMPDGKENYFLWGRFDEYSIANMLKNEVNGRKRDSRQGTFPNTNYWLRIQRTGNVFNLSEKGAEADAWNQVGSVTREDFAGLPLQVGIEHTVFDGGRTLKAGYKNFSLAVSNMGPFAPEPAPATELSIHADTNYGAVLSWTPGKGSDGSLVIMWKGTDILKHAPADGMNYQANAELGKGDTLPGTNCFVVYAGTDSKVTVARAPLIGSRRYAAVFSYAGSGKNIRYSRLPAIACKVID